MRNRSTRLLCSSWLVLLSCSQTTPEEGPSSGGSGTAGGAATAAGGSGTAGGSGGLAGSGPPVGSAGGTSSTGGDGGVAGSAPGGSGSSGSTGGTPSAGGADSGGTTGATGGTGAREYSSDPSTFFGPSRCEGFVVCESFEETNAGSLPAGFTLEGYGTRTVGVVDDAGARGDRSLRFQIPSQGSVTAWLTMKTPTELAHAHFGRVFVRIASPAPTEFIHFDLFAGIGAFDGHSNEVRWASTGTGVGTASSNWSFIYNVQPFGDGAGPEFGTEGDRSAHPSVDAWMCLEWSFDESAQEARFFLDGSEIEYLHIDSERAEIPSFDSFAVGFAKYQTTAAIVVNIDELAFDVTRIGCNN